MTIQIQTIFGIITNMIESKSLTVPPLSQEVIFEKGERVVSVYHDEYGRLCLTALNKTGRMCVSNPLAYNPPSSLPSDWRLAPLARYFYDAWVLDMKKGGRPFWHYRAEVDDIILQNGVDRDEAVKIFKEESSA